MENTERTVMIPLDDLSDAEYFTEMREGLAISDAEAAKLMWARRARAEGWEVFKNEPEYHYAKIGDVIWDYFGGWAMCM